MGPINFKKLFETPGETISELCAIDLVGIEHDMQHHASLYGLANAHLQDAKVDLEQAKMDLEYTKDQAFRDVVRQEPNIAVGKATLLANTDITVASARKKYTVAARRVGVLAALVSALEHRRDMLVQLAARQRADRMAHQA